MLGVATIVIVAILGYVGYNALKGLPFQSRYDVNVTLRDADRLIVTDDVRIADVRVGEVQAVTAEPPHDGVPAHAVVKLALDPAVGRLPVDTTVQVGAASVLGATFVGLTLGHSHTTLPPGGTLPLAHATPTVSVTDLFQVFDGAAAQHFQSATAEMADGLAGRGGAVNSTIGSVAGLLPSLTDVASALDAPGTQLPRFITAFATTGAALAPKSVELAGLVSGAGTTFSAFARERASLAALIDALPSTEAAGTTAFRSVLPGLSQLATLASQLAPAARGVPTALAMLSSAAAAGVEPLRSLPTLTGPLRSAFAALDRVSAMPSTGGALRKLGSLMSAIQQSVVALLPAQVHCDVISLFGQDLGGYLAALGTGEGPAVANSAISTAGVIGEQAQRATPPLGMHIDNLPTENATECQAGNEPYNPNVTVLAPPSGSLPDHTRSNYPPPGALQRAASVGLLAPTPPNR